MDEMTLELNSPITEEQWDILEDVDFDNTESICFHTKHGKEVEFVKRKKGRWKRRLVDSGFNADWYCSECGWETAIEEHGYNYCPNCGADMRGEKDDESRSNINAQTDTRARGMGATDKSSGI